MAKITYIEHDGTEHQADVAPGQTLKDGAVNNMIPGVLAECGGNCACATCHVYIDHGWTDRVGPANEMEADMLDFAHEPQENSRLSCQVEVTAEMDGLIIRIPEKQ